MTLSCERQARRPSPGGEAAEAAAGWAAVMAAGGAVFAWAACCVLPMSLALVGFGLGGLSWFAEQRGWITLAALGVIGAGWLWTWRRARSCRAEGGCGPSSRLGTGLLGVATLLVLLAMVWKPIVEPWALALIQGARG